MAKQLIQTTIEKHEISADQLIIHSDRGPSMRSHSVAHLLGSLGVTKSHSRPHVSNDNPFSESQFKTMKYRLDFPQRFGSYEDALGFCRRFFHWYNNEYYHSGIAMMTPASLHDGQAKEILSAREETLERAWQQTPERFVQGIPKPQCLPKSVWINAPNRETEKKNEAPAVHSAEAPGETSLTHPRSGHPLDGCVPAEPSSVSPDTATIPHESTLNTRVMPKKSRGFGGWPPAVMNSVSKLSHKLVSKSLTHSGRAGGSPEVTRWLLTD